MYLFGREFITGESFTAFQQGVEAIVGIKRLHRVKLLRLSVKQNNKSIAVVHSIWGREGRAPMKIFRFTITSPFPSDPLKLTTEHWSHIGQTVGNDMQDWIENEKEFDSSELKAHALQFNVWDTSEFWDVIQDLIDELEHTYSTHLHGKLHWRVRAALTSMIETLALAIKADTLASLAKPENLALLRTAVRQAGLKLQQKREPADVDS